MLTTPLSRDNVVTEKVSGTLSRPRRIARDNADDLSAFDVTRECYAAIAFDARYRGNHD